MTLLYVPYSERGIDGLPFQIDLNVFTTSDE
jgi:hypothetical protein